MRLDVSTVGIVGDDEGMTVLALKIKGKLFGTRHGFPRFSYITPIVDVKMSLLNKLTK